MNLGEVFSFVTPEPRRQVSVSGGSANRVRTLRAFKTSARRRPTCLVNDRRRRIVPCRNAGRGTLPPSWAPPDLAQRGDGQLREKGEAHSGSACEWCVPGVRCLAVCIGQDHSVSELHRLREAVAPHRFREDEWVCWGRKCHCGVAAGRVWRATVHLVEHRNGELRLAAPGDAERALRTARDHGARVGHTGNPEGFRRVGGRGHWRRRRWW